MDPRVAFPSLMAKLAAENALDERFARSLFRKDDPTAVPELTTTIEPALPNWKELDLPSFYPSQLLFPIVQNELPRNLSIFEHAEHRSANFAKCLFSADLVYAYLAKGITMPECKKWVAREFLALSPSLHALVSLALQGKQWTVGQSALVLKFPMPSNFDVPEFKIDWSNGVSWYATFSSLGPYLQSLEVCKDELIIKLRTAAAVPIENGFDDISVNVSSKKQKVVVDCARRILDLYSLTANPKVCGCRLFEKHLLFHNQSNGGKIGRAHV